MDPLRVEAILREEREDHALVAEQLRILSKLEGTLVGADEKRIDRNLQLYREASYFFQSKLLPHFDSEEHGMFAFFRDHLPNGSTIIYELQSDHQEMRRLCEELRVELKLLRHRRYQRRPALLAHLQALCARITRLLSQHAEREDQLVHNIISSEHRECSLSV
jgi:hemerythrin-like domain-containing protein